MAPARRARPGWESALRLVAERPGAVGDPARHRTTMIMPGRDGRAAVLAIMGFE